MRLRLNLLKFCLPILLVTLSCKNRLKPETFKPVTEQEIYAVINAVVKQGRIDTINRNKKYPFRIIDSLENNKVYFPKPDILIAGKFYFSPPPIGEISYQHLLQSKTKCFSANDSTFLIYQNQYPNNLVLTQAKFPFIPIVTSRVSTQDNYKSTLYSTITISAPIFSKDHDKAYVQVGFHTSIFGGGMEYFLIKVNGQWQVKLKHNTWIS